MIDGMYPTELAIDKQDPLYWIVINHTGDFSLIGFVSNNNDRWRWCSYDTNGKEYVEWDSAVSADMITSESSVLNVDLPPVQWMDLVKLFNQMSHLHRLKFLRTEFLFQTRQMDTKRTMKLRNQLQKFDPVAALELCE